MFRVTADNVAQKRTIRPLYAQHQATPWAGSLDPTWDSTTADILPGMVMTRAVSNINGISTEVFRPCTAATDVPFGLSALFVAPKLGIDEIRPTGTGAFAVWVGDNQSVFEVLAPAFASDITSASVPAAGAVVPLYSTTSAHAEGPGLLTAATANATTAPAAFLLNVIGTEKIVVQLADSSIQIPA